MSNTLMPVTVEYIQEDKWLAHIVDADGNEVGLQNLTCIEGSVDFALEMLENGISDPWQTEQSRIIAEIKINAFQERWRELVLFVTERRDRDRCGAYQVSVYRVSNDSKGEKCGELKFKALVTKLVEFESWESKPDVNIDERECKSRVLAAVRNHLAGFTPL
jgi:uncharacterized protein YrzB (UPF0473 family)